VENWFFNLIINELFFCDAAISLCVTYVYPTYVNNVKCCTQNCSQN